MKKFLFSLIIVSLNQLYCAQFRPLEELADKQVQSDAQRSLNEVDELAQQLTSSFEGRGKMVAHNQERFSNDPDLIDPQLFKDALKKFDTAKDARYDADFAELLDAKINRLKKDESEKKQVAILEDYFAQRYGSGERSEILQNLYANARNMRTLFNESNGIITQKKQEVLSEFNRREALRKAMEKIP